jgi:alkanesulfonate monooxygenase SsuD/methylene tetrahydromethanopterin reductase-like flavin-dependent oxidoreductase (luciferase family)
MASLRIGAYFDLRNPPRWRRPGPDVYRWALDRAADADARGLDSIWLSEHHRFADGYLPQPLTMAAAIAARTERVRIGIAVVVAGLHHPAELAEQAAVVDLISAGRLELGFGAGYAAADFELFGAERSRRFELLEQRVGEVGELLASGTVTPSPVQSPLPIWVGAGGPRGARIAGRLGAGLLALGGRLLDPYREGLEQGGHGEGAARTGGVLDLILADDPEATWAAIKPHVAYQQESYALAAGQAPPATTEPGRGVPPVEVLTPDAALARVRAAIAGKPVTDIFFWASIAGMPREIADRHLDLLCEQLAPALRRGAGGPEATPGDPEDAVSVL